MPFEHAGSQYFSVLFVAQRDGLAPWPCQRRASERCMRTDCRGLKFFVSVRSRRENMPTYGRDVPSVRISLQSLITVSFFSLSVHSPNVVSIYPPAVCTQCHPLPSQRLSRHQWTLTQRTEHRHSSLKQRTHFRCLCIS